MFLEDLEEFSPYQMIMRLFAPLLAIRFLEKIWKEMSLGRIDSREFKVKEELFLLDIKKVK